MSWLTSSRIALLLLVLPLGACGGGAVVGEGEAVEAWTVRTNVGVDTNGDGNTATKLGPIERCAALGRGEQRQIDVVVDAIDSSTGLLGFGFSLLYDPKVLRVVRLDTDQMLAAHCRETLSISDQTPDQDGELRIDEVDQNADCAEAGAGVLARVTVEAVGSGKSPLTLAQSAAGEGVPAFILQDGRDVTMGRVRGAEIVVD